MTEEKQPETSETLVKSPPLVTNLIELIKNEETIINEYLDTVDVTEFKQDIRSLIGKLRTEYSHDLSKVKSKILAYVKTA